MAKNTFWLVGIGGVGKTTLAVALAGYHSSRPGIVCALRTEFGMVSRFDASTGDFAEAHDEALLDGADFLFIEVQPRDFKQSMTRPADHVIRIDRMPVAAPQEVAHG